MKNTKRQGFRPHRFKQKGKAINVTATITESLNRVIRVEAAITNKSVSQLLHDILVERYSKATYIISR
jgi:hypothetical protein